MVVITPEQARRYWEVCEEYKQVEKSGEDAVTEFLKSNPHITPEGVCNWAVYGWPVQDELTMESWMDEVAEYVEDLRAHNQLLREIIEERQAMIDKQLEKLQSVQ